jgi:hypothetical protein
MKYHQKLNVNKKYESFALVYGAVRGEGVSDFLEMCRYDSCHPIDSTTCYDFLRNLLEDNEVPGWIVLRRFEADPRWGFTPRRWESFGYNCVPVTEFEANEIMEDRLKYSDILITRR